MLRLPLPHSFPCRALARPGFRALAFAAGGAAIVALAGCSQSTTPPSASAPKGVAATESQALGVRLLETLNRDPSLQIGSDVSIGTLGKQVILNGRVSTVAQKTRIARLVQQKAPGFAVKNLLVVAPRATPKSAPKATAKNHKSGTVKADATKRPASHS